MEKQRRRVSIHPARAIDLNELCRTDDRFKSGQTQIRITRPEVLEQLIALEEARKMCWEQEITTQGDQ
jgi:hypothetical protein